jgi:hypothetical protein
MWVVSFTLRPFSSLQRVPRVLDRRLYEPQGRGVVARRKLPYCAGYHRTPVIQSVHLFCDSKLYFIQSLICRAMLNILILPYKYIDYRWQNKAAYGSLGFYLCVHYVEAKYQSETSSDELFLKRLWLPETNLEFSGWMDCNIGLNETEYEIEVWYNAMMEQCSH